MPLANLVSRSGVGPRRAAALCGAALLLALALVTNPVRAIDITVDVLGDPPPDGCTPGSCSLREAVTLANSLAGPDRILLPATPGVPLQLSIPGDSEDANATGDLDVLDDLEIAGTGVTTTTLVQTAADRVLHAPMPYERHLILRSLRIQGGRTTLVGGGLSARSRVTVEDVAFVDNEAINEGGAVHSLPNPLPVSMVDYLLVLRRVRFERNSVTHPTLGRGGAVFAGSILDNLPRLLIEDCDFIDNESKAGGGALMVYALEKTYGGQLVVRRSRFSGNRTGGSSGGAAILQTRQSLTSSSSQYEVQIEDSRFDGNATTSDQANAAGAVGLEVTRLAVVLRSTFWSNSGVRGGAVKSSDVLRIVDSHLFDNVASLSGGAVWSRSDLVVERSTFESNRVTSADPVDAGGGAIGLSGNVLDIQRSTFAGNSAWRGGAISLVSGSMNLYGSTVVANSTVVIGQSATAIRILDEDNGNTLRVANTIVRGSCSLPTTSRQWTSAYNNIESPAASCRFDSAVVNAQNQVNASTASLALGTLADNGGPTPTRLPGAGSIAIDTGRESFCTATDQRGFARTDANCDIGAVEVGATAPTPAIFIDGFE